MERGGLNSKKNPHAEVIKLNNCKTITVFLVHSILCVPVCASTNKTHLLNFLERRALMLSRGSHYAAAAGSELTEMLRLAWLSA